jgi:hypothetical protein
LRIVADAVVSKLIRAVWLRIKEQLLVQRHGAGELVIQFLAHQHRKCVAVQSCRKKFAIGGRAEVQIERGGWVLDQVVARAARRYEAQVE